MKGEYMRDKIFYPFVAIVGQEKMKEGLILNVINPTLSGILIRGEKGTAKSTAVRALAEILPEIEVVANCPFQCHPRDKNLMCPSCRERLEKGEEFEVERRKIRVIDLPISATEDRVVGTMDLEHALKKGEKRMEPGILAAAHRGILYVDEVNLLDDHVVDVLLDAAAMGVNTVEREGVSFTHPSRFILVGTMNPEEGELRPQLLDRFGLCVNIEGLRDPSLRVEIIRRRSEFDEDPVAFVRAWEDESKKLVESIKQAAELYSQQVEIDEAMLREIVHICLEVGVDGHRADIIMQKVARTICSYRGRKEVIREDVEYAAQFALPHRVRRQPFEEMAGNIDERLRMERGRV
jgi:magnesium chelatase subunit I